MLNQKYVRGGKAILDLRFIGIGLTFAIFKQISFSLAHQGLLTWERASFKLQWNDYKLYQETK